MNTGDANAQTDPTTTARIDIVVAFQSLQTAQRQGASNMDLLPLVDQLNLALQYERNATILEQQNKTALAADSAIQAIDLSTRVSLEAQRLGNDAQSAAIGRTALAYSVALVTAVPTAAAVVEAPRIKRLLERRRVSKTRIVSNEGKHEK